MECISLLSMVGKIYAGIQVDRVWSMMSKGGSPKSRWVIKHKKKKFILYVGFMDLKKTYDRVNSEALWQVLRMYDVGGKLLNGIKSMYVNSLA